LKGNVYDRDTEAQREAGERARVRGLNGADVDEVVGCQDDGHRVKSQGRLDSVARFPVLSVCLCLCGEYFFWGPEMRR